MLLIRHVQICLAPIALVVTWLIFSWSLAFIVDIFQLVDFYSIIPNPKYDFPLLWYFLFSEASPTENLQWILLFLGFITALILWFKLKQNRKSQAVYWLALAAGLLIMLIEDSLNFRHLVYSYYIESHLNSMELMAPYYKTIWELFFYSLLSALMIYSGYNLVSSLKPSGVCFAFLFTGYFLYGIATFGSAARKVYDWQERFGDWIINKYALYEIPNWEHGLNSLAYARENIEGYTHTMGYLLIDHWYEESLELLAAGFLITGILLLARCQFEQINTKRY